MDSRWFIGEHAIQSDSAEDQIEILIGKGEVLETNLYPGFGEILGATNRESREWGQRGFLFLNAVEIPNIVDKEQAALTDSVSLLLLPDDPVAASRLDLAEIVTSHLDEVSSELCTSLSVIRTEQFLTRVLGTRSGVVLLGGDGTQIDLFTCSSSQADAFGKLIENMEFE